MSRCDDGERDAHDPGANGGVGSAALGSDGESATHERAAALGEGEYRVVFRTAADESTAADSRGRVIDVLRRIIGRGSS